MKSKILILSMCISLASFAQEEMKNPKNPKGKLGLKAEIGAAKIFEVRDDLSPISDIEQKWGPSFNIGVFLDHKISEKSQVSAELKYSHYTSTMVINNIAFYDINGEAEYADVPYDFRLSYLSLPVYYSYKIGKFSPNLGLNGNFLISDRMTTKVPAVNGNPENVSHESIETDQFDFGARIGVGYSLNDHFTIDAAYYHGLNNLVDWDTGSYKLEWYNRQITLGVKFWFEES